MFKFLKINAQDTRQTITISISFLSTKTMCIRQPSAAIFVTQMIDALFGHYNSKLADVILNMNVALVFTVKDSLQDFQTCVNYSNNNLFDLFFCTLNLNYLLI